MTYLIGDPVDGPPHPQLTVYIGAEASVQFGGDRHLVMSIISVDPRYTTPGYHWIRGYVMGEDNQAVAVREVYVQDGGLRVATWAPPARPRR